MREDNFLEELQRQARCELRHSGSPAIVEILLVSIALDGLRTSLALGFVGLTQFRI